jgi:isochorismate synthase EntC
MGKLSEDYKRKYLLLEVSNKKEKNIIIDAIKDYIEKCTEDIKTYSKSEAYIRADDIQRLAATIATCMKWRDNIEVMGSDMGPRDFQFYENGIERII